MLWPLDLGFFVRRRQAAGAFRKVSSDCQIAHLPHETPSAAAERFRWYVVSGVRRCLLDRSDGLARGKTNGCFSLGNCRTRTQVLKKIWPFYFSERSMKRSSNFFPSKSRIGNDWEVLEVSQEDSISTNDIVPRLAPSGHPHRRVRSD